VALFCPDPGGSPPNEIGGEAWNTQYDVENRMSLARDLAQRIVSLRYEDLPAAAIEGSRIGVMDTLGVAIAGAGEDCCRLLSAATHIGPEAGPCQIWGTAHRAGALDAALINGTAAHALDFDNGSNTMGGHASATMVPALLAAAEAYGGSGRDILLGHTVGFETGTHIGRGVNFHHYEVGWHPTSTLGTFAVIGACASLLRLDIDQTATALAIGTSLASGIKSNFGTMTKPLHVGHCARNGLFAVLLARNGYTASPAAFEHKQGFFNVFNGLGNYDESRILPGWADPLEIVRPGAGYKQYPCCAATHAALDATLELVRRHGCYDPARVARVETWTPARRLAHTNRPDPVSNLDAKFSVQYCVARALLEGRIVLGHFEDEAFRDPAIRKLMSRIESTIHRPGQFAPENHFGAEVRITLSDGNTHTARVDIQLGRTADNPVPPAQLCQKFEHCAARVLPADNTRRLAAMLEKLENAHSIHDLTKLAALAPDISTGRSAA